ncbi:MAG: penicillin acylase family protein, partial [Burkholderiaceae bacterium]
MRALKWVGSAVGLLALAGGFAALGYVILVAPKVDGAIEVSGLRAEVRIDRDAHGIPTIRAQSAEDAMFGLGFAHAQDRLWQLETHRRIGSGRLAEAFGAPAVESDKFLRALGVKRAAQAQWAKASPQLREAMNAYAAGVNAYAAQAMRARPPEFVLLGLDFEPWTAQDSFAWAIMMAWDLGGNWRTELLRLRLALKMPVQRIDELIPPYPGEKALATADYSALFRSLRLDGKLGEHALQFAPPSGVEGVGSNNWVVSGGHTESGKPLLANDPHLKLSAPALWYFARLEAPHLRVAGATMPGLPVVVLGQNESLAWGFTNTGPDVQDLYLERIKPDDPALYQTPQGWARFETFAETLKVKGQADMTLTVRATRHGPVISDAGIAEGLTGAKDKPGYALALRWTALDADPGTMEASMALNRATTVEQSVQALGPYVAPMQNIVIADRDGRIGVLSAGRVPLRKPANDLKGQVPAPGWDARYDWDGFLDPGLTPREFDPARGWIATANQRIHAPEYPHYITNEWFVPYRQQRIEQLLAAKPRHSLASLREIQADVVSLATLRLLPYLRRAQSPHALAQAAQQQLAAFDGTMHAEAPAPLIFWAWARQLTLAVFGDDVGPVLFERTLANRSFRDALEGVLERNDEHWCDRQDTATVETCAQQIDASFTRALDELAQQYGADVAKWQWGAAHVARSEHRPLSNVALLAPWFELRTPVGGDTYTVNVSRVGLRPLARTGELYLDEHGPSLRALYDLGDPSKSRVIHSGGQSGIVFSPLYRSFVAAWA